MTDLVESDDELLDPQPAPQAAPANRMVGTWQRLRARLLFGADSDPRRRRRAVLACAVTIALVAGAGTAGVAMHRADLHRNQTKIQSRTLFHLLGGGASMTFNGGDADSIHMAIPSRFDIPIATDFTIAVRNDGAQPLDVTTVRVEQPGVDMVTPAPKATVKPGESVSLTTRVAVHCTAADLPQYPSGVTVTVRTAGDKTKPAGKPTDVAMAFEHGSHDSVVADADQISSYVVGGFATNSFYHLCANVLALMPPEIIANVLPSGTSPQNPVVRYRLHVEGTPGAPQIVTPTPSPTHIPGVSVETDLSGQKPLGDSGLDVTVTDRITDCAAFGDYLALRGGALVTADVLHSAAPLTLEPADPRFRPAAAPRPIGEGMGLFEKITSDGRTVLGTMLGELTAACPQL